MRTSGPVGGASGLSSASSLAGTGVFFALGRPALTKSLQQRRRCHPGRVNVIAAVHVESMAWSNIPASGRPRGRGWASSDLGPHGGNSQMLEGFQGIRDIILDTVSSGIDSTAHERVIGGCGALTIAQTHQTTSYFPQTFAISHHTLFSEFSNQFRAMVLTRFMPVQYLRV